jgi:hypothetical protein
VPCDCDYEGCEGWGMEPHDDFDFHKRLRNP